MTEPARSSAVKVATTSIPFLMVASAASRDSGSASWSASCIVLLCVLLNKDVNSISKSGSLGDNHESCVHSEDDDLGVGDARRGEERGRVKICNKVERKREGRFNMRIRTPPLLFRKVPVPGDQRSTTIMGPAIALLICGGLTGIAKERNGDYLEIYHTFLKDTSHTDFTLDPYFVARDPSLFPDEDQYDCIMLTGSGIVSLPLTLISLLCYIHPTFPTLKPSFACSSCPSSQRGILVTSSISRICIRKY